jgi:hypothetical protein
MIRKNNFSIGQEIPLPDGTTGIFCEWSEIGEMRIEGERRTWWLFPEDIELGEETNDAE